MPTHNRLQPVAIAAAIVAVQALLVAFFAWPAIRTAPRDLPIVVAGPAPVATVAADRLAAARPGAFDITVVADAAAADAALRDREAYAAIVAGPDGPSLHLASAASPVVAQLVTQQAQALGGGAPVPVVDVVPTDSDDPRGAGLAAAFLPLLLTSIAAGVVLILLVGGVWRRLAGIVAYAVLAGLATAAILQYGYAAIPGSYLANAATFGLVAAAIAAGVAGLGAVLGRPGLALGALLVFVLGNPLSGLASAPELLPQPWGAIGQLLPPGAGATLVRSVAFFDGAGGAAALWTLAAWTVVGLALVAVGRRGHLAAHSRPASPATGTADAPVAVGT
ncbi:MAG TPA: hypothetical protein VFR67_15340 [Pilimelia sp.]|nr:hypothetical protein [Pilimelia sp.]